MIQDIAPHLYHNEYRPAAPDAESIVLSYRGEEVLLREANGTIDFPRFAELEGKVPDLYEHAVYLFSIDRLRFYLVSALTPALLSDCRFEGMRFLREARPRYLAFAGVTGFQLSEWYKKRRFCGCCGTPLLHHAAERMMYCPACHTTEYPQLSPAVIAAVTDGDRLLLTKYEGRAHKRHALIAGFAEIGETIEETVHREVMEEVGLRVKNLRYYKSQPWSFSGSLLFGFVCEVDGSTTITLDRTELSFGEWFARADIPDEGEDISLTKEMMMAFKHRRL